MMTTKSFGTRLGSAAVLLAGIACADLEVTNPNNPDVKRALATAEDVQNLAISTINSWYLNSTYIEPYMMTEVTADVLTANFGNFGMRFNNLEPRIAYGNNSAGNDRTVTESPWNGNYGALGAANDAIRAFDGGITLATPALTAKFKALAQFSQAASLANLAMIFDQAFAIDETFDPATSAAPTLVPYAQVATMAMAKWDVVIAATAGKSETYDPSVFPMTAGPLTSARLNRLSNTMAARTLMLMPRTAAENNAVNWGKVLAYAEKGISGTQGAGNPFDVTVVGDNNNWYSYINYYGNETSWLNVDMRVINMMDPAQPAKFTGTIVPKSAAPPDNRLNTDFNFENKVIGDPARGIYMQSPWSHKRYVYHARQGITPAEGPVPYILQAENDLMIAEALVRTNGDLGRAATLINNTRVTRGGLPAMTAGSGTAELLSAIFYERTVELLNTNALGLFDGRRRDALQPGTARHLPIPAKELETLALPIYTFGGVGLPDKNVMLSSGASIGLHFPAARPSPTRSRVSAQK